MGQVGRMEGIGSGQQHLHKKCLKVVDGVGLLAGANREFIVNLADHPDFGIIRCIVSDPERATQALRDVGYTVRLTNVLAVEIPDEPGSLLDRVAEPLAREGINLEYFYAFIEPVPGKAMVVIKVSDPDRAEQVLEI